MIPRAPFLLVRKYVRPEKIGSILTPEAYRVDNSRALWELEQASSEADEKLGGVEQDWILVTAARSGVYVGDSWTTREDGRPDRKELFILHADTIARVIPWTRGTEMARPRGKRITIRPDDPKEVSTLLVTPDTARRRPSTGRVIALGAEVDESDFPDEERLREGVRVLYNTYTGTNLTVNGEPQVILLADQVLAVIPEGEEVDLA